MTLPTGKWQMDSNGSNGELYLTAIDIQGNVTGMVFGNQLLGFWDDVAKKLTFMRLINPTDPSTFQVYTGYLFFGPGATPTYYLTGYFEGFSGSGARAQSSQSGWFASIF